MSSDATPRRPLPRESPDRCAFRAEVRGDAMLGTAFPAARVLLVEQPGSWGPDGLTESDFDHRVAHELKDRARAAGVRVQAIRRPGRSDGDTVRAWALADCRPSREALRWGTYRREAELLELPLDGSAGTPDPAPAVLVCTHGRHDPCCALRGRPTAAALSAARPAQVWETSHTGGDRFAANVLVLPTGLVYGRVEVDDVPALLDHVDRGAVWGEHLRGKVGLAPVAQAAWALAEREVGPATVRMAEPIRDGRAVVRLDGPSGELVVAVRVGRRPAAGLTCHNPGPSRYLTYHPEFVSSDL